MNAPPAAGAPLLSVRLRHEHDVVAARQRTRQIAGLLGFDTIEQTRIATAVSEVARNAFRYAGGGRVDFALEGTTAPQMFMVRVTDTGPGIPDVAHVLSGQYRSSTGMGLGLIGARRLMDGFEIDSAPGRGTCVVLRRFLPRRVGALDAGAVARITERLAHAQPQSPYEEVQRQNQELLGMLEELQRRQQELERLNRELEDTNRGVVALYAELDEKADHLRRADQLKSRFLSNMTHEFRTPLNAIQALSRLLLQRSDGELTDEQERQAQLILHSAEGLSELVNDLLDLAKVEAGKTVVRPVEFEVRDLFAALRGMLRPLLVNDAVNLVFGPADDLPPLYTDESKVSQVLRNFISNALKFTERGTVEVSATMAGDRAHMVFAVRDTGIGIAPEDRDRIFHEFAQVEHALQRRVRGTGLGLPLSKRLIELLGGRLELDSTPRIGSTFSAILPIQFTPAPALADAGEWQPDPFRMPVLIVEDMPETFLTYQKYLRGTMFEGIPARTLREASLALQRFRPRAIVLDLLLKGEDAWEFLGALGNDAHTRDIPVLVVTTLDDTGKALALGARCVERKPIDGGVLLARLAELTGRHTGKILVIDDDAASRAVVRMGLAGTRHELIEVSNGAEGLERARAESPDLIVLDLVMPGMDGMEVLERLRVDPVTRHIPVAVHSGRELDRAERNVLTRDALVVVAKRSTSPEQAREVMRELLTRAGLSAEPA